MSRPLEVSIPMITSSTVSACSASTACRRRAPSTVSDTAKWVSCSPCSPRTVTSCWVSPQSSPTKIISSSCGSRRRVEENSGALMVECSAARHPTSHRFSPSSSRGTILSKGSAAQGDWVLSCCRLFAPRLARREREDQGCSGCTGCFPQHPQFPQTDYYYFVEGGPGATWPH